MSAPASLFPPTPEKVLEAFRVLFEGSILLAETMATLIINFVGDTFRVVL